MDDTIKFIFWNVRKSINNVHLLLEYGITNAIQVIAILEAPPEIENIELFGQYRLLQQMEPEKMVGIKVFLRADCNRNTMFLREHRRFGLLRFEDWNINLVIAHFTSQLHGGEDERYADIQSIGKAIDYLENRINSKHTIIMGDLNIDLFDKEMIGFSGLNARLFRYQVREQGRRVHDENRDLFYDPMLKVFQDYEEESSPKGTLFYKSSPRQWFCYDHVLMKFPIIERFQVNSLQILNSIGTQQLVKEHKIVENTSDHLPVYFEINV